MMSVPGPLAGAAISDNKRWYMPNYIKAISVVENFQVEPNSTYFSFNPDTYLYNVEIYF